MEKITIFIVYASTGCSCCRGENHYRGPFKTREAAEQHVESCKSVPILSSQYASKGRYDIEEHEGEVLPDGRVIIDDDYVAEGFSEDTMNYVILSMRH